MPEVTGDERQRVRSYLIAQAAKLALPDLVAKVRTDTRPLRDATAAVPAVRWAERPAGGEWSAAEIAAHVLEMNEHGASSIEAILDGRPLPANVDDVVRTDTGAAPADASAFWAAFEPRREALYARVLQAAGDEHLDVALHHPWFGDFNWREWLLFMRVHDLDHLRQLEKLREE